ncbi:hypothetical protein STEG23_021099, partial [Scotinomys teguina]
IISEGLVGAGDVFLLPQVVPLLSTAHSSDVQHMAAHASRELRCNVSYAQVSAEVILYPSVVFDAIED